VGRRFENDGEPGLNQGRTKPFAALVHQLLKHDPPLDGYGRPLPHKVTLSAGATRERRRFHNAVESMMEESGDLADCRDIGAKCVSQTCKVALVLHLAESPLLISQPASEITGSTWAAAQSIGAWFLAEAVRVQRAADEDPTVEAARRILDWLQKCPRETLNSSVVMQMGPRPRLKANEVARVLTLLSDLGYLRPDLEQSTRRMVYRVHPALAGVDHEK